MITRHTIQQFYADVEALGLKHPVADISRATGAGKGNVSNYLSGKLEPSESFLNAFYKAFKDKLPISSKKVVESSKDERLDYQAQLAKLIDVTSELSKSNASLSKTNEVQTEMLRKANPPVIDTERLHLADAALQMIFRLAAHCGMFDSPEAASIEYSRLVSDSVGKKKVRSS